MTIALGIKVHDGFVLAADSAATLAHPTGGVSHVYNNANKVFNLYKGLPIGGMCWGTGSVGAASVTTLAKDFRRRIMGLSDNHKDWTLNAETYTIQDVAVSLRKFLFEEVCVNDPNNNNIVMGLLVAGYSANSDLPEAWEIRISKGKCSAPKVTIQGASGMHVGGQHGAIVRLLNGIDPGTFAHLRQMGIPADQCNVIMEQLSLRLRVNMIPPPMPIQDAIDLATFLVDMTINFSRFSPGAPTVGGPIEVAAITKHEGYKWVRRKYYFDAQLNPIEGKDTNHD